MSRMIAFVSERTTSFAEAIGADRSRQFAELSALHSDGWGTAHLTGTPGIAGSVNSQRFDADTAATVDVPTRARMLYLRFASGGSARGPENSQPFVRDDLAFQHNGALPRPEDARELLHRHALSSLRGSSDSELYFALICQHLEGRPASISAVVGATRLAVIELRMTFANCCLNAFILTPQALVVVHSSGSAPVPVAAFAARGFGRDDLPRGHDDSYNRLAWTTGAGTTVVATSGIDRSGWNELGEDTVTWFPLDGTQPDYASI